MYTTAKSFVTRGFLTSVHVLFGILHAAFYFATILGDPGIVTACMRASSSAPCDWKYCETCNIDRPFRAKHCPEPGCNYCVSRFDHYCGFIGAPVGAGNEVPFMFLCLFAFIDSLFAVLNATWVLLAPSDDRPDSPGLLNLLHAGHLLSMATVVSLWHRAPVVSVCC
jgi:hypothetical protein